MWIAETAPKAVKQSWLGFAPQNGHSNEMGLVGSSGNFGLAIFGAWQTGRWLDRLNNEREWPLTYMALCSAAANPAFSLI
jgi:hypothetical protein